MLSPSAMRRRLALVAPLFAVVLLDACHRAKPASPDVTPMPTQSPAQPAAPSRDPAPTVPATPNPSENAAAERRARARASLEQTVYFRFDLAELDAAAQALLDAKADVLRADASYTIRIEGYADDRGSDEYNVALSMRRAAAVKRYLANRGIAEARLETAAFGEERPTCVAPDESCWAKNRRAEFVVRGGE